MKKTFQTINHDGMRERLKMSVTQVMKQYQSILEEEVHDIAYETGVIKRQGKIDARALGTDSHLRILARPRAAFEWIGTNSRKKRSECDRISYQPTFYARMCRNVPQHHATAG